MKKDLEYIICTANHYDDGVEHIHQPRNIKSGFVVCGRRHHNCIGIFSMIVGFPYDENGIKLMNTEIQGFLTNKDRFVDREEAFKIAKSANQISPEDDSGKLYSEDIY